MSDKCRSPDELRFRYLVELSEKLIGGSPIVWKVTSGCFTAEALPLSIGIVTWRLVIVKYTASTKTKHL